MLTRLLTGRATIPRDERVQDETMLRRPTSLPASGTTVASQQGYQPSCLKVGLYSTSFTRAIAR